MRNARLLTHAQWAYSCWAFPKRQILSKGHVCSCYLFLFFYFKLVVVVRAGLRCGNVDFFQSFQALGVSQLLCAALLRKCFHTGNKMGEFAGPVDKGVLVPELSPELCFDS